MSFHPRPWIEQSADRGTGIRLRKSAFGGRPWNGGAPSFDGAIADIVIVAKALSSGERTSLDDYFTASGVCERFASLDLPVRRVQDQAGVIAVAKTALGNFGKAHFGEHRGKRFGVVHELVAVRSKDSIDADCWGVKPVDCIVRRIGHGSPPVISIEVDLQVRDDDPDIAPGRSRRWNSRKTNSADSNGMCLMQCSVKIPRT